MKDNQFKDNQITGIKLIPYRIPPNEVKHIPITCWSEIERDDGIAYNDNKERDNGMRKSKYTIGDIVLAIDADPQKYLLCTIIGAEVYYNVDEHEITGEYFYTLEGYNLGNKTVFCKYESDIKDVEEQTNV